MNAWIQRLIGKYFPNRDDQVHAQMCHGLEAEGMTQALPLRRWEKRLMLRYPKDTR